jgi:hypothetical protein
MRTQRLNNHPLKLALAALTLVALAAVACNGDDSSPADGSPSPDGSPTSAFTPVVTPGTGEVPLQAVGNYIEIYGLDGHRLDTSRVADCPAEAIQTVVAGTPTIVSRLALNQFCLAAKDFEPDKAITVIVDLPDTGKSWEMKLEFDSEVSLWEIKDVKKVSG